MGLLFLLLEGLVMAVTMSIHWSFWVPVGIIAVTALLTWLSGVDFDLTSVRRPERNGCIPLTALLVYYVLGFISISAVFGEGWVIAAVAVSIVAMMVRD